MRQKLLLALALALLSPAAATLTRTHVARPVRRLAQSEAGECKGPHAEFCRDECKNNKKKNSRKRCKDKCRAACRETGLYHKDPMKTCPIAFWAGEYTTEPLSRHGLEVMAGSQLSGPAMYYKVIVQPVTSLHARTRAHESTSHTTITRALHPCRSMLIAAMAVKMRSCALAFSAEPMSWKTTAKLAAREMRAMCTTATARTRRMCPPYALR
jgi:hypothetical protein